MKLTKSKCCYALTSFKLFIRDHITCIAISMLCVIAGIIIGIFTARSFGEDYTKLNFIISLQAGEYSYLKTWIIYALIATAAYALLILCGLNRWLNLLAFCAMIYLGYRCGIGMVGCYNQGAVSGIICILLFYLPIFLCLAIGLTYSLCLITGARCGSKGIFSSQNLIKSTVAKIAPAYIINMCVIFACTVIIPFLYKIIFM